MLWPKPTKTKATLEANFGHQLPDIWQAASRDKHRIWVAFYGLLGVFILSLALNIVQAGRPANVILVDKLGNAAYHPEAASPEPPQTYEAANFASYWLGLFLSRDVIMAKEDLAKALTLTDAPLQNILRDRLIASGEIDKVRDANVHTTIRCTKVAVTESTKDRHLVEVQGTRFLTALDAGHKQVQEPFEFQLVLRVVNRTRETPNGLVVRFLTGHWGAGEAIAGGDQRR